MKAFKDLSDNFEKNKKVYEYVFEKDLCEKLELNEEELSIFRNLVSFNHLTIVNGNLQENIEKITDSKLKEKFFKALKIIEEGENNLS